MPWWFWLLLATAALYAVFVGGLFVTGRREDARAIAGVVPDSIVLARRLFADQRVPRRYKALLLAVIAYLVLPFDLVPDFIPVAGQLDDVLLIAFALRLLLRSCGPDVVREHWPGPARVLNAIMRLA